MSAFHRNTWIRAERRVAIYMRDNFTCLFCGIKYDRANLSLDHIVPVSKGGSNESTNLATCCKNCNSKKGDSCFIEYCATNCNNGAAESILHHIYHNSITRDMINAAKVWLTENKMQCTINRDK